MAGEPRITNHPSGVRTAPSSVTEVAKPAAIISTSADINRLLELYDPDKENEVKRLSYETFSEKAAIPRTEAGQPTKFSGRFVLSGAGGRGQSIIREAYGWGQFDKLRASEEWKRGKLRESHGFAPRLAARMVKAYGSSDPKLREAFDGFSLGEPTDSTGGTGSPNDTFRPFPLGPFNRQLYLYDMLDMQAKAFQAWNHNPIARALVNLMCHFVLGDGPKVKWRAPQLQERWDRWVVSSKWDEKTRLWFRDCSILGETFLHDPGSRFGAPSMTLFDASTVWEIMTNPRNIDDVFFLHRQFPTQYQVPYGDGPKVLDATGGMSIPTSEYVIEQFPPDEWLQVKLNATIGEKRGRSDLFTVLGWLKRFTDWFNAAVVKAQISNAFVVWWNINGNDGDVQAFKNNPDFRTLPPPGSQWFTNNAAVPNLLTAETGGISATDLTGAQLLSIIATSLNLPPEFLGVAGAAARATALKRGEPAGKIFEARQQLVREVITWQARRFAASQIAGGHVPTNIFGKASTSRIMELIRRRDDASLAKAGALIAAMRAGKVVTEPIDEAFNIIMPAIETQDRTILIRDYATARGLGVYSKETVAAHVAEALDDHEYDYDDEQEKIRSEEEEAVADAPLMPGGRAPGQPGDRPAAGTNGAIPAAPADQPAKPGSSDDNRRYADQTRGAPVKR